MNNIDEYRDLLDGYRVGMYTGNEVISKTIRLLYASEDRDAMWQALTPQHRQAATEIISSFDESAEPFAIRMDPLQLWKEMSTLKRWLGGRET